MVVCPFTGLNCKFYIREPRNENMDEKSISYWCFLCLLGQLVSVLRDIYLDIPREV